MKSSGTNCSRKSVTTFEVFTSSLVLSVFRDVSTLKMSFPSVYLFNISSSTLVHDIFFISPLTPIPLDLHPPPSPLTLKVICSDEILRYSCPYPQRSLSQKIRLLYFTFPGILPRTINHRPTSLVHHSSSSTPVPSLPF